MSGDEQFLTAAECAREIGLSVRALRVYEAAGLLKPRRTAKNWRIYGASEVARLGEILALKAAGFSLAGIGAVLSERESDFSALIEAQHDQVQRKKMQLEQTLSLLSGLRGKIANGEHLSLDDLVTFAKENNAMTVNTETAAWKRYEQTRPRTEVALDSSSLENLPGYYRFEDGSFCHIAMDGQKLYLQLRGQPRVELFAESEIMFFMKVVPAQVSFELAGDRVEKLVLHQHGLEMNALPCDPESFTRSEAELSERIGNKTPLAGGEALLRELIAEHRVGAPDYARMSEPLAQIVQEQLPVVQAELERAGELVSLSFKGVDESGFDIYRASFKNAVRELGVSLGDNGVVNGLYILPTV